MNSFSYYLNQAMVDITHKISTKREAIATGIVKVGSQSTIDAINNGEVPKGNIFDMAKAAALLGVKNTPMIIPDCHPLPIEKAIIDYRIEGLEIHIDMSVATIYKTGVEVEAMHGVSVAALTMYDMLKPIDKNVEIGMIRLKEKTGGKSDFKNRFKSDITCEVVITSDAIFKKIKEDKIRPKFEEKLSLHEIVIQGYTVIQDDISLIKNVLEIKLASKPDIIIVAGGTGMAPTDYTSQFIAGFIDTEVPGIMEAARNYGQQRTPYSMFSRSIAGIKDEVLILNFPASTQGVTEYLDALFPGILHGLRMMKKKR